MRHPARVAGASLLRLQSDARLAELAIAGHEAAFDAIVDRYRTPLTRYCAGIVGPSRAEDAAQQALINAHDALQRTDEVRHLKPWLYRIAHNAALNVLRAVRDDVPLEEASSAGPLAAAASAGPAESFERSEQFRSTLAALQALPERQRAALVLRELEGRSHEEIAEALGVTKGSARQHLMRARVAVRSAVTAVTPYPLVARLAELVGGGAAGGAGWVDAVGGAGASAGLVKLTAGLAATGALVGGAVGTQQLVERGGGGADAGAAKVTAAPSSRPGAPKAEPVVVKRAATEVAPAGRTPGTTTRSKAPAKRTSSHTIVKRRATARHKTPSGAATPPAAAPAAPQQTTSENATPNHGAAAEKQRDRGKANGKSKANGKTKGNSRSDGAKGVGQGREKPSSSEPKPTKTKNPKAAKPQSTDAGQNSTPAESTPNSGNGNGNSSNNGNGNANGNGKGSNGKSTDASTTPTPTPTSEPSPTDGD
jgi:RNA polymerase sigma factor (sigma-70 family)